MIYEIKALPAITLRGRGLRRRGGLDFGATPRRITTSEKDAKADATLTHVKKDALDAIQADEMLNVSKVSAPSMTPPDGPGLSMKKDELAALYESATGEAPPAEWTKADILEGIKRADDGAQDPPEGGED